MDNFINIDIDDIEESLCQYNVYLENGTDSLLVASFDYLSEAKQFAAEYTTVLFCEFLEEMSDRVPQSFLDGHEEKDFSLAVYDSFNTEEDNKGRLVITFEWQDFMDDDDFEDDLPY